MADITPQNIGENLTGLRIADYYTSLLHVSGADVLAMPVNDVYTGNGRVTGLSLSALNDRVIINRYIEPKGFNVQTEWLDAFYPMHSIMLTVTNDNPKNRIAGTNWCLESNGAFMVGVGEGSDRNDPPYTYSFSPGLSGVKSGDRAGEYCVKINASELPAHTHTVNPATKEIGSFDTSKTFCFYFGDTVNPQGLTMFNGQVISDQPQLLGNFANVRYGYLLEQNKIQAFQNNTSYDGQENYRDWLIKQRHTEGYRYTDADFSPKIANFSLEGWGGTAVGGPGWGGLAAVIINEQPVSVFVKNAPRPVNTPAPRSASLPGEPDPGVGDFTIRRSNYDPRNDAKVHPGTFGPRDLIRARNIIVDVLGREEAAIALEGVNMLKELDADEQYDPLTTLEQVPGQGVTRTTATKGATVCHNNILPNYGVYVWRRVPLDYECPVGETPVDPDCGPGFEKDENGQCVPIPTPPEPETTWRGLIRQSYKNLNLRAWALGKGWNGSDAAHITVTGQKYLWSDRTDRAGLIIDGAWPKGLTLENHGKIMGRGGDGGSYADTKQKGGPKPPGGGYFTGWDGGPGMLIGTTSKIIINNRNAIAGGGGGGTAGTTGNFGGGGGGAGGGRGGTGAKESSSGGKYSHGGSGGNIGRKGNDGRNWLRSSSYTPRLQGKGGEAGGGGSGGFKKSGDDPHGGGGGGGRILRDQGLNNPGGAGGAKGGGNGGGRGNKGSNVSSSEGGNWGNAGGGGGWGADGGRATHKPITARGGGPERPKGGKGGAAIVYTGGASSNNVTFANVGVIYGAR